MRKYKEFLLLFLPFFVFTALPITLFFTARADSPLYIAEAYFFRDMLDIAAIRLPALHTYCVGAVSAFVTVIIFAVLKILIKPMKRKLMYLLAMPSSLLISFIALFWSSMRYMGLPMSFYLDTHSMVAKMSIFNYFSPYQIIFALQLSFFAVLMYWIIETAVLKIKNR